MESGVELHSQHRLYVSSGWPMERVIGPLHGAVRWKQRKKEGNTHTYSTALPMREKQGGLNMLGKLNQKKVWAQVLVFALLFAMLPTAALAVEEIDENYISISSSTDLPEGSNLEDGKIYRLESDVAISGSLNIAANTVALFDLNGHTLSRETGNELFHVVGTLSIQDGRGGGIVDGSVVNWGTLTISDGVFQKEIIGVNGRIMISGGTFEGIVRSSSDSNCEIQISDGTFTNRVTNGNQSSMNISGGTFVEEASPSDSFDNPLALENNGILEISGGIFKGGVRNNGRLQIVNGSFGASNDSDQYKFGHYLINWGSLIISNGSFLGEVKNLGYMGISDGTFLVGHIKILLSAKVL